MTPAKLPVRAEPVPNNPAHEFMFDVCDGQPPARQKRLVLRAMDVFLAPEDAQVVLDALGLREV